MLNLLLALTFALTLPDDSSMRRLYEFGDIKSLAGSISAQPDTVADKIFLRALLESDAKSALKEYESLISRFPQSMWVPYSLERLTAYYLALENRDNAEKCRSRLRRDFPGVRGLINLDLLLVAPKTDEPIASASVASEKDLSRIWSVQVGAFRNKKGAEDTGRKVSSLGKPIYSESRNSKGPITVVKIGKFDNKIDAENLAERVREKTGLKPVVVVSIENE